MKKTPLIIFLAVAPALFAACSAPTVNSPAPSNANATNANTAKPVAAAPTKEALIDLEKSAWEAWKNKDTKQWDEYLSDRYVAFGPMGRLDKAAEIKLLTGSPIDVKSYSFSDEQMTQLGPDVAVLTFRAQQDYTVDGKPGPKEVLSSSVYVREGDKWKSLSYIENVVPDPKAPPTKAAPAKKEEPKLPETTPLTDALMAIETKAWEAWKHRDKAGVEAVMGKDFFYMSALGRKGRDDAIKLWAEPKCTGLDYQLSDPVAMPVTPEVSLVTYKASAKGTCDGQPVPPSLWVASYDMKEGDTWKNAFYTDVPR